MKAIGIFLTLVFATSGTAQIGAKVQQQNKIYGVWHNSQLGFQMTLLLNPDGTGEFDGEPIKFSLQGTKLSVVQAGTTTVYNHTLNGNSLTLSGGDLDTPIIFSRSGGKETPAISQTTLPANQTSSNENLVGVWSYQNETVEFKADGTCNYLGNVFQYEVSQGHIILATAQGNVMFAYSVQGNKLNLTANGQQFIYTRGTGNNLTNNSNANGTGAGTGKVAMELVGRWCYMNNSLNSSTNKCITLNADGTYLYNGESSRTVSTPDLYGGTSSQGSDSGTWYVQGNRIYYNSRTQGQGSYLLEKRNHPKNPGLRDRNVEESLEIKVLCEVRLSFRSSNLLDHLPQPFIHLCHLGILRAEPFAKYFHDLSGHFRSVGHDFVERILVYAQQEAVLQCSDGSGPRLGIEQRKLTKKIARFQLREHVVAIVNFH
jgi:hypothetical protein